MLANIRRRRILFGVGGYSKKLLALFGSSIVGYWPMWEPSGTVSTDIGGRSRNGAYTAVTLAQTGIGDGRTAAQFVAASLSNNNLYSAGLAGDWTPAQFSLLVWGQATSWDTSFRDLFHFGVDDNNRVILQKMNDATQLRAFYIGAAATASVTFAHGSPAGFFHFAATVLCQAADTNAANVLKVYYNGAQVGTTQTGLSKIAGALAVDRQHVGAGTAGNTSNWNGKGAHAILLNVVATPAQIALAAMVP